MTLAVILIVLAVVLGIAWFALPSIRPILVGIAVAIVGFMVAALTELGNLLQGLV